MSVQLKSQLAASKVDATTQNWVLRELGYPPHDMTMADRIKMIQQLYFPDIEAPV
jgi:hypothetical protein